MLLNHNSFVGVKVKYLAILALFCFSIKTDFFFQPLLKARFNRFIAVHLHSETWVSCVRG